MLAPSQHTYAVAVGDTGLRRWLRDQDLEGREREFDENVRAGKLDALVVASAFREIGAVEGLQ